MTRPPQESRIEPPWQTAAPDEKIKYVGVAIIGFAVPWVLVIAMILVTAFGLPNSRVGPYSAAPGIDLILVLITGVLDLTGTVLTFAARNRTARGLGWGAFISLLTHVVAVAFVILVLFGWYVSYLDRNSV